MKFTNRHILPLLAAAFLLVFQFFNVEKQVPDETNYYKTKTELNVRKGPGKEYSVLFTLKKWAQVEVLSKEKDWYEIKRAGKSGYVRSRYLTVVGEGI